MTTTIDDSQARMMREMTMIQSGATVSENADGSFAVPSQTSAKSYEVRLLGERFVCTCPDFEHRQIEACKHIHLVKFCIALRHINNESKPKVFASDAIPCVRCGSIRVIHYGIRSGKQVFYCKDCKRKFQEQTMLKKVQFSPELITLTLDLYFSGLSLRKIARNISDHFNVHVEYTTIYSWITKYVPMISEYVNTLAPKTLSDTWHADEMFVKLKGWQFHKSNARIGFLWNVMDRESRFLLASKLSEERDRFGGTAAFKEALANAHGLTPSEVRADSLNSYPLIVKATMPEAKLIANCGIRKQHQNNNRIERLNGTLSERVKVQRGWKTIKTQLAEGQRIQYNFVKPHMALDGKTPAEVSGIKLEGINKWLTLMRNADKRTYKERS